MNNYKAKVKELRVLVCGYRRDEAGGSRFWVPECMGGAVYGRKGCTCERRGPRRVERRRS
jgi:hypothetical protein